MQVSTARAVSVLCSTVLLLTGTTGAVVASVALAGAYELQVLILSQTWLILLLINSVLLMGASVVGLVGASLNPYRGFSFLKLYCYMVGFVILLTMAQTIYGEVDVFLSYANGVQGVLGSTAFHCPQEPSMDFCNHQRRIAYVCNAAPFLIMLIIGGLSFGFGIIFAGALQEHTRYSGKSLCI